MAAMNARGTRGRAKRCPRARLAWQPAISEAVSDACERWPAISEAIFGRELTEAKLEAGRRRTAMTWAEDKLFKALRVKYTAKELRSIIKCVAHALSEDKKTGNPRLRRTT